MKSKQQFYWWCVTFGVFFIIISPNFLSEGMFMDGIIYSTLAKNLALNSGSFWAPHFSETFSPVFFGHPPLSFWLESLFFRLFGFNFLIDKLYSLSIILLTVFFIVKIWNFHKLQHSWLPALLWLTNPIVFWTSTNNMLENPLTLFVTMSIFFYLKSNTKYRFPMLILSGLSVTLGVLSKGLVALFPLAFPFFYFFIKPKSSFAKMLLNTIILIIIAILPLVILYQFNEASHNFFIQYTQTQLFTSFKYARVSNRFYIILQTFFQLLPFIIISIIAIAAAKIKKLEIKYSHNLIILYFAIALSATIPIMVTLKQSVVYVIPAMPFYSIGFALILIPLVEKINIKKPLYFKVFAAIIIITALLLNLYNYKKIGRDKELLPEVHQLIEKIPQNEIINTNYDIYSTWNFNAYLTRYKNISLDSRNNQKHEFLLLRKSNLYDTTNYSLYFSTKNFNLYKLKSCKN